MSYRGGYCSFEFQLENVLKLNEKVYSPPFATSTCRHWMLIFDPYTKDPKNYQILLYTIHNKNNEESNRFVDTFLPLKVMLKAPSGDIIHEVFTDDKIFVKSGFFLVLNRPRSLLPNNIIINVQFSEVRFTKIPPKMSLGTKQVAENLVRAWSNELNKPDRGDVKIKVQGRIIYANSSILVMRSEYFETMFEGEWIECNKRKSNNNNKNNRNNHNNSNNNNNNNNHNNDDNKNNNNHNTSSGSSIITEDEIDEDRYKYEIEITDFNYDTVFAMIHFLYTDESNFVNYSLDNIWNLFSISDKYFVEELRQRVKIHIIGMLNVTNAAEMLFKYAWKWPDLKEMIKNFNVDNFVKIRKTRGFKQIVASKLEYPMYHELLEEILLELYPEYEDF